jgi:hypothetical protein
MTHLAWTPRALVADVDRWRSSRSRTKPDYEIDYKVFRALSSNRYIRRYYLDKSATSPSLRKLDQHIIAKLAANDIDRIRAARYALLILALLGFLWVSGSSDFYSVLGSGAILIAIAWELARAVRLRRYEQSVADKIFVAILVLEQNTLYWNITKFRWIYAAYLEDVAKEIEHIPRGLSGIAPSIRSIFMGISREKAQAMRELEIWLVRPGPSTLADLTARLVNDLCTVVDGRWYDLPEAKYERQVSVSARTVRIGVAVLAMAGAGVLLVLRIPGAPVFAGLLIVLAIAFLEIAGLPKGLERYVLIATNIISGK